MLSMTTTPKDVIDRLRGPRYRVRTAIWLAPPELWRREADHAARLGIHAADARDPILGALAPGQRRLGLNADRVLRALETIADAPAPVDCRLVYNFDLLIARLPSQARDALWDTLYKGFPHHAPLLIAMPRDARALLPREERLAAWQQDGRLAE